MIFLKSIYKITFRTLKPGHLEEDVQSQRFLKTNSQDSQVFFRKETNKIEGSTIQPLKTGNCPQIFNVICPFAQKNIANLLFSENVMIGHSSSKCPGLSVRIVNEMLRRLFYDYRL